MHFSTKFLMACALTAITTQAVELYSDPNKYPSKHSLAQVTQEAETDNLA